jgi:hypothetical protein
MTYTTIQNDVQSFLGFALNASSRVNTTEVAQWINQDYRMAQSKMADANINYYQGETVEDDTTDGTDTYALPAKFLKMKRLEIQYDDDEDKVRATPIDINDIWSTLDPDDDPWSQEKPYYALWENDFILKPMPDETSSAWTTDPGSAYKMWFIEEQDDISGNTEPALPSAYQHILAFGATARGFRKLKKFNDANQYQALWLQGLSDMVSENTSKDKTKPMGFTVTRGSSTRHGIYRPSGSALGSSVYSR